MEEGLGADVKQGKDDTRKVEEREVVKRKDKYSIATQEYNDLQVSSL